MVKLYHNPDSRSTRFIWLLEEIGEPYEIQYTDIPRWSGKGKPDPTNPHPDKRVPALVHDGQLVTESAAIALYLTDLFPGKQLGADMGDAKRGEYLTWLAFYAGEIEPAYGLFRRNWLDNDPHRAMAKDYERVLARVLGALSKGPFLMGDRFTAVDVLVSSPFQWTREFAPESALMDEWLARLAERPAFAKSLELDVGTGVRTINP